MGSYISRMKFNKTLRNWMVSYIIMFSLPFLLGAFLTFQSYHQHTAAKIHSLQYHALTMVQTTMDNMLQNAVNTCQALALDSRAAFLEVFQNHEKLSNRQSLSAKELQNLLGIYVSTNEDFSKVLLYFPKTDYVMSRDRFHRVEAFQAVEALMFGMSSEEFRSLADHTKNGLHIINETPLYTYTVPLNGGASPSLMIAIYFNEGILSDLFYSNDSMLFLEGADGVLFPALSDSEAEKQLSEKYLSGWEADGSRNTHGSSVLRLSSPWYSIHFYSISSSSVFRTGVVLFCGLGLYLLIGSIIGILLAVWLSKRNYQPVAELLSLVAKNSRQTILPEHDDFYVIRSSYQALLSAYQDNRRTLREWQSEKTNSWMNRLFKEKKRSAQTVFQENTVWSEAMTLDSFVLMSVEITDFSKLEQTSGQLTKSRQKKTEGNEEVASEIGSDIVDMAYFIVKNCLDELLNESYTSFSGETDGRLYALINVSKEEPVTDIQQTLRRCATDLQNFIQLHYGMLLSVNISSRRTGVEHITDCYQDIEELLLYRNYVNQEEESTLSLLDAEPEPELHDEHAAAAAFSNQIYSTLRHGNRQELLQLFSNIWQQRNRFHHLRTSGENLPLYLSLQELSDFRIDKPTTDKQENMEFLSNSVTDTASAASDFPNLTESQTASIKPDTGSPSGFPAKGGFPAEAVSDPDRIEVVIEQISDYIQEHYQDPLLSVGVIADEFHLGLSFLSRNYKEQKNVGILESINRLRLERAKELIVSGVSIKDAATQVGFYSTQPLIRIFKQIEHMTPSEYRNQHRA